MELSSNGETFLMLQEGFREKPYLDNKGIPTIGNGTTLYPGTNKKVTMADPPITKGMALEYMRMHLRAEVYPLIKKHIKSILNQNQFDALSSFIYNLGPQAMINKNGTRTGINMRINGNPNDPLIRNEFMKWDKKNPSVNARHGREADLYFH